jgi:hypothetical protein
MKGKGPKLMHVFTKKKKKKGHIYRERITTTPLHLFKCLKTNPKMHRPLQIKAVNAMKNRAHIYKDDDGNHLKALESEKMNATICRSLVGSATVYHIWKQRKDIKHGNRLRTEEIRLRIMAKGRLKKTKENLEICLTED